MDRWTLAGMAPPIALLSAWPCAASSKGGTMETKGETKAATGAGPRLDQFVPTAGAPGDPVLITGAGLAETTAVSFGKAPGGFKDIMSYCPPYWISDHNYLAALFWLTFLEKHR